MWRRQRKDLKESAEQGSSLPLVVCAGALLLAFALAIVYTAGLMLANANGKVREERCYQLARSFSQVLGRELQDEGSSFYAFANEFLNNSVYSEYRAGNEDTIYHYAMTSGEDENYGDIHIRLYKELNEDAGSSADLLVFPVTEGADYTEQLRNYSGQKFLRYVFTVDVIAEYEGLTYRYSTEYYREDTYKLEYKYEDQAVRWVPGTGEEGTGAWEYLAGGAVAFAPDAEISYRYRTEEEPETVEFKEVHEERGDF